MPDFAIGICECEHKREKHNNGLYECRLCSCKKFVTATIPDIFEDDDLDTQEGRDSTTEAEFYQMP